MKLYLNQTSSYARLVMVTAHEAGVAESSAMVQRLGLGRARHSMEMTRPE